MSDLALAFIAGALFGCAARHFIARREREDAIESCPHFQAVSAVFNPDPAYLPPEPVTCGVAGVQSGDPAFNPDDVCVEAEGETAAPGASNFRGRPHLRIVH